MGCCSVAAGRSKHGVGAAWQPPQLHTLSTYRGRVTGVSRDGLHTRQLLLQGLELVGAVSRQDEGACAPLAFARRRERAAPMPPVAPKTRVTGPCAPLPVAYAARCQGEADSSCLAGAARTSALLSNILFLRV